MGENSHEKSQKKVELWYKIKRYEEGVDEPGGNSRVQAEGWE